MTRDNNSFFRQLLFLVVLIAIGVILFRHLKFFVGSFLGAITIYIVLRNTMFRMVERQGMHRWFAALVLVAATAMVLAGFAWLSVKTVGSELVNINVDGLVGRGRALLQQANDRLGLKIDLQDVMSSSEGVLKAVVNAVLNTTYSFTANILMMLLILYFMFAKGRKMEAKMWEYAPFKDKSLEMIKHELKTMIYSNAVGMPVILILQTLASTLIYWLLGFTNPWFWGFITALCGLVPAVGTMLVYLPVAVWMVASGDVLNGIILMLYGAVVISNVDNVLRIVLLHKVADTHPLVVIFGVIMGIPLFGFWGIIFGPLFISCFILLVNIYYTEYGLWEKDPGHHKKPVRKAVPPHFKKIHEKMCEPAVVAPPVASPKDSAPAE